MSRGAIQFLVSCWCVLVSIICICNTNVVVVTSVTMELNVTQITSGDWVQLSFSGVPQNEREDCWIGVFAPSDANVSAIPAPDNARTVPWDPRHPIDEPFDLPGSTFTPPWTASAPIKYLMCTEADAGFAKTGGGQKAFTLLNMRTDVVFWLFYNGLDKPQAMNHSAVITFANINRPMHVHIARTSDPSEMRVSWNSKLVTGNPRIKYGFQSGQYTMEVAAESATYSADDMCGGPANGQGWFDPGYMHTGVIRGLTPGSTVVYYIVGEDASQGGGWTPEYSFTASQSPGADTPLLLSVIGDVGATELDGCHYHWEEPDADKTIQHLGECNPDLILHIGDLSYATGYETKWELFMHEIESVATARPYMTAQGNHEQDWPGTDTSVGGEDSGGECGTSTEARFVMPTPSRKGYNGWYSVEQGPVHLLVMDTELECGPGSMQYAFFESDLQSVDRSRTPWLIFAGHRQMYKNNDGPMSPLAVFEPLLMKYEVDLALWGHIHIAQATYPVYNGSRVYANETGAYDAPIHCVIGNGGQGPGTYDNATADWNAWGMGQWGWNTIHIFNSTHLSVTFYDESDNVKHQFGIYRNRN